MKQYSRFGVLFLIAMAQLLVAVVSFGDSTPTPSAPPAPLSGGTPTYVRISRAFFEKTLQAQVKLSPPNSSSSASKTYSSSVDWVQYPPTSPAPQQNDPQLGQVLADFRDYVACAEMPELGESRLCFKVMADVSNLGVNDNEMTLRGIDSIETGDTGASTDSTQCTASTPTPAASSKPAADGGPASRYQLQKATVSANSLELEFKYSNGCGPNVQLTLTQVP